MTKKHYRAYALIETKEASDEKRVIRGIATSATVDRMGDIVEMEGVTVAADIPLFLYHDSTKTVGRARLEKPTKKGIPFEAKLPNVTEEGLLKQRIDEAWQMCRYGLITAVSIGFSAREYSFIEGGGVRFLDVEILELSLVPVPAQPDAVIQSVKANDQAARTALIQRIKSADQALLAASGHGQRRPGGPDNPPGVSGTKQQPASGGFFHSRKETIMKTLQQLQEERATKSARMTELTELRAKAGKFTPEESKEFSDLDVEVADLDEEITVKRFEERQASAATAVRGKSSAEGSASRGGLSFVRKNDPDDKFEGQSYIRALKLKTLSRLTQESVGALAVNMYGKTHPKFVQVVRAAVAGGGTDSGEWGAELLSLNAQYEADFIAYLYGKTLFDQLGLREVPANVRIKGQDGAAAANWVGQSRAIPVSAQDYSSIDLTPLKVAALCVLSNELIADSSPSADRLARDSLVEASAQKVDSTFFSATAASSGVSPAGILEGLSAQAPSGTDEAAVRTDMQALLYPFVQAKMASGIVLCMNPAQGLALGSMINAFSQPSFPGLNENGGTYGGRKVYCGDNVTPGQILAMRPEDIWKIGDGGIQVSMSDVATIEMNDAPAGRSDTPVAMASHAVSMFQTESTAFKVVRRINFQKRRSNAVVYIDNAEYGGVAS